MTISTDIEISDRRTSPHVYSDPTVEAERLQSVSTCSTSPEPSTSPQTRCPLHTGKDDSDLQCKSKKLDDNQNEEITSRLLDPITISFSDQRARQRALTSGAANILPEHVYRTYYENSATLCSRVSKDTHTKHREVPDLSIEPGNAFQAIGRRVLNKAVTKEGIERHLKWQKKHDPSQWISVFDDLYYAERRADFHYDISERIGDRVSVAKISLAGLVPATLSATWEIVWEVFTQLKPRKAPEKASKTSCVELFDIPVWISKEAVPSDCSSMTGQQLEDKKGELWVSIEELRLSGLRNGILGHKVKGCLMTKGHPHEWLALHSIPEWRITNVMPWDGDTLHKTQTKRIVRSKYSTDDWVFNWKTQCWKLDTVLFGFSQYQDDSLFPKPKPRDIIESVKKLYSHASYHQKKYKKVSRRLQQPRHRCVSKPLHSVGKCDSCGSNRRKRMRREASV